MPKFPTFPTLYDDCKRISITKLKEWGYLQPGIFKSGLITWSSNGNKTGSISITTDTMSENPFIELDYTCNKEPIKYRVQLVSVPSNLRKGAVWYFICPNTRKRCRKLYLVSTYFLHREAFQGCMYEKQTESHRNRMLGRQFEKLFGGDKAYDQIYKKHFKTHYAGEPTKRYKKLWQKIQAASNISEADIQNIYRNKN